MKLDIGDILSRSWRITWRHKTLWLLGFLVALPGSCSSGFNASDRFQGRGDGPRMPDGADGLGRGMDDLTRSLPAGLREYLSQLMNEVTSLRQSEILVDRPLLLPGIILLLLATLLLVWLLVGLAGLVARVGLVRGIDRIDAGADAPNLRQAWGLGWSARTLRLLLAEVLMGILSLILILPVILMAVLPLILVVPMQAEADSPELLPILAGVGILLAGVFLILLLASLLQALRQLWTREIVIADTPIGAAVSQALATMRRQPGSIFLFWLALLLVGMGVFLALLPVSLVMALLFAGLGLGLGALLKAVLGGLLGAFGGLISLLLGLALSGAIFGLPLAAFEGLYAVFTTSAWTLAWRRLRGDGTEIPAVQPAAGEAPAAWPAADNGNA